MNGMGLESNQVVKESAKVMNTQKNWKWALVAIPCGVVLPEEGWRLILELMERQHFGKSKWRKDDYE